MTSVRNTILVTGGAGFIGSNFVLQWIKNVGTAVVNLDLLTYAGNPENLAALEGDSRHQLVRGDICDPQVVAETAKSPLGVIVMLFNDSDWLLARVNVFAALVVPTFCFA